MQSQWLYPKHAIKHTKIINDRNLEMNKGFTVKNLPLKGSQSITLFSFFFLFFFVENLIFFFYNLPFPCLFSQIFFNTYFPPKLIHPSGNQSIIFLVHFLIFLSLLLLQVVYHSLQNSLSFRFFISISFQHPTIFILFSSSLKVKVFFFFFFKASLCPFENHIQLISHVSFSTKTL